MTKQTEKPSGITTEFWALWGTVLHLMASGATTAPAQLWQLVLVVSVYGLSRGVLKWRLGAIKTGLLTAEFWAVVGLYLAEHQNALDPAVGWPVAVLVSALIVGRTLSKLCEREELPAEPETRGAPAMVAAAGLATAGALVLVLGAVTLPSCAGLAKTWNAPLGKPAAAEGTTGQTEAPAGPIGPPAPIKLELPAGEGQPPAKVELSVPPAKEGTTGAAVVAGGQAVAMAAGRPDVAMAIGTAGALVSVLAAAFGRKRT